MSESVVATLNIPFTQDDGLGDNAGKNRIVLQQVTKRLGVTGQLIARCFPHRDVKFVASVGQVEVKETRSWPQWEAVKFSKSSSAKLKFPGATNVVLDTTTSVLMRKTTDIYGKVRIQPATGIALRWDADEELVVAETSLGKRVEVYGACFVNYEALYSMLYYTPNTAATPVGGADYAFSWSTGTIFGYNDYTVETLDLELDMSSPPDWVEFARVTSKIVLTADGVWEYPDSWETTYQNNKKITDPTLKETFNEGTFAEPFNLSKYTIDPDQSFTDERVHCIIKVNTIGTLQYEDFNNGGDDYWAWNIPHFGRSTYNPKYEVTWTDPPGGKKASSAEDFKHDVNNRTWRDVFLSVDKDDIKVRLRNEYPNIKDSDGKAL